MPDRRLDIESRQRVVALESRYRKVARHLTLGFAALTLGVVLALALVWRLSLDNRDQGRELQDNRVDVIESSCAQRNREHVVMRDLLARSVGNARALKDEGTINEAQLERSLRETRHAIAQFPIERDCRAYAENQVHP